MPIEAPLAHSHSSHAQSYRSLPSSDRSLIDENDLIDAEIVDHHSGRSRDFAYRSAVIRVDGPAAHETSDEAAESAIAVLAQSSVAELRFLRVDENDEAIHLTGQVGSFYHKQLAQEAVRVVAGTRQVFNRVNVLPQAQTESITGKQR